MTILEKDEERTSTFGPEDKEDDDNAKSLTLRDDISRQYLSRKEGGRGLTCIEDSVDASIQGLK